MMESLVYQVSPVNQDLQDIRHTQEWVVRWGLSHAANTHMYTYACANMHSKSKHKTDYLKGLLTHLDTWFILTLCQQPPFKAAETHTKSPAGPENKPYTWSHIHAQPWNTESPSSTCTCTHLMYLHWCNFNHFPMILPVLHVFCCISFYFFLTLMNDQFWLNTVNLKPVLPLQGLGSQMAGVLDGKNGPQGMLTGSRVRRC